MFPFFPFFLRLPPPLTATDATAAAAAEEEEAKDEAEDEEEEDEDDDEDDEEEKEAEEGLEEGSEKTVKSSGGMSMWRASSWCFGQYRRTSSTTPFSHRQRCTNPGAACPQVGCHDMVHLPRLKGKKEERRRKKEEGRRKKEYGET